MKGKVRERERGGGGREREREREGEVRLSFVSLPCVCSLKLTYMDVCTNMQ